MRAGRRWLALDADLMFNPFTERLIDRFGWAGLAVWIALLCAAKRSPVAGQISFTNDTDAAALLGVDAFDLVDNEGREWSLGDFWKFTGCQKQTRKTCNGRRWHVTVSHWERWQKGLRRDENAQRMANERRAHPAHSKNSNGTQNEHAMSTREERRGDPPNPPKGGEMSSAQNVNPKQVGPGVAAALKATMRGEDA